MYSLIWAPYLFLIFYLYNDRIKRIYAASIIILCALLGYKLPIFSGFQAPLFHVGVVFTMGLLFVQIAIYQSKILCDRFLFKIVAVYSGFFFLSVLFNFQESVTIPTYLVRLIGYFPLFVLTIVSLNSKKDINTLLTAIVISGIVMAIIGIGQYVYNDSLWGIQSTRKIIGSGESYFTESITIGKGSILGFRVSSSASNPNSFSAVMCMTLVLSSYLISIYKNRLILIILYGGMLLQLIGLIISGSRTGLVTIVVIFAWKFIHSLRTRSVFKKIPQIFIVISIISIVFVNSAFYDDYFKKNVIARYERILEKGEQSFFSGGVRMERAWIPYLKRIEPEMFVIGYGTPGIPTEEDTDQMSRTTHNDLLAILYFSGFWGFLAFLCILFRYFYVIRYIPDSRLRQTLMLVMVAYLLFGVSAESFIHKGQPFIFWPLIALAARRSLLFDGKDLFNNSKDCQHKTMVIDDRK